MALPQNKKCLKSEPSFGPSLPASPTFIRSSREPCTHTSTPPVVVIQTHPPGPDSGQRELCQSSGKKTKCIHSFTFAEHSLCARHCLGNAGVTTIPARRTRSGQSAARGGRGCYGESREEIWMSRGSPAGGRGRRIKKSKGPGEGSCVASQARRQADVWTVGGDPGESRAPRSRQGANPRTLYTTFRGSRLEPGQPRGLWRVSICFFTSVLKNHSGC